MYDQKRREVNKAFDKYEKQIKAAKASGKNAKQNADKVSAPVVFLGEALESATMKHLRAKPMFVQVRDAAARQQAKRNKDKADDDTSANVNQPQRWSDYTVEFHFPEPTELPPPLIQLIDVDFKYPSRYYPSSL